MKKVLVAALVIVLVGLCVGSWKLRHRNDSGVGLKASVTAPLPTSGQTSRDPQGLFRKFAQVPLSFEPNRGQFDPQVKFVARGADYGLFLAGAQTTIVHQGTVPEDGGDLSSAMGTMKKSERGTKSVTVLSWIGANEKAEPRASGMQRAKSNYFIGNDPRKWHRHVEHYDRVQLTGLYPGIDLVYHGVQKQVEFDYVIAPHANPAAIQVGISGPSIVGLDAAGQLSISSSGDRLLLMPPVAYQEKNGKRENVEVHYALSASHQFGFRLGNYDASLPMVIDPVLEFATSFGPNSNDTIVSDVVLDATGNIYITGTTCETNYPTTIGVFQPAGGNNLSQACNDAIVTKLDPTASTLIYSTYIGGQTGVDFGIRLLVDTAGEVTIVGDTSSTDFPTTAGVFQPQAKGGTCNYSINLTDQPCSDAFLLKLSADGSTLDYSTLYGGGRADLALTLAQDAAGDTYIAGETNSTDLPLAGSPFQSAYGGAGDCQGGTVPCGDVFIAKFNSTGTQLLASTYVGGDETDFAAGLALDTAGDVYIAGSSYSTTYPTTAGSFQPTHAGGADNRDGFVSKFDSNLHTLQYSTFIGGADDDIAFAIRVDSTGAAYITGSTLSATFPTTTGAFQRTYAGPDPSTATCGSSLDSGILAQPDCGDVFIAKIDPSQPTGSQLVFSTYLGGSSNDFAYNLALDSQKNVWVVGDSNSPNFPYSNDAYFKPPNGSLFLSEIKNDGTQLVFSTGLSILNGGLALGIAIDATDNVVVAGQGTVSPTPGTYSLGTPGQVFVMKYSPGTAQPGVTLSNTLLSFSGVTNSATPPQSVTLTNSGTGTLHLLTTLVNNSGNPLAFSEMDNCPAALAAQATCTINVTYLPTIPGNDGVTVQILDDAPGAPHTIFVSATNALTTSSSFVPATLSFPGQQPGVASPAQTSGLTSNSAGANNIFATTTSAPVLSGPNVSDFNVDVSQCPAKSNDCFVSVIFTPAASATGTRTATLTVTSNAPNSPHTLALTGTVATGAFAVLTAGAQNATTVGQTLNTNIFVKNTGGATLNVTGFNITGVNAADFAVSAGDCGPALTLAPQATCFVNLAFTPGATGNRTAMITLADNETTPASLTLNGTGAAAGGPQINANIFGNPAFSDTTVGQNTSLFGVPVTLTNFGTGASASAHVTGVTLTGDFMTEADSGLGPTCATGFVLTGSEGSCVVDVFFAPLSAGPHTGLLTIHTDAPGTPSFSFTFTGNGIQTAAVLLTPSTLNFGKEVVGGTTATQPVTLTNTGNGPLNISGLGISGPFTQTTTCGASLAAGATCVFNVAFKPTVAGSGSGLVTFTGNAAGGGAFAVGLSGTGATGPTPQAVPAGLNFGNQAINTVSPAQIVTFSNAGDMAFSFVGVRASENFSATSNCPNSIGPGVTCNISIKFAPTPDVNTGFSTNGSVFVTTNAPGSPFMIPVSGVATQSSGAATLATIATSLSPSTIGQAVTFTATITSTTAGTPTGTVTFLDNGNALGAPVTLNGQAKATFTTTSLAPGNHSIFCMYSGDATFAPATSSGIGQVVLATSSTTVVSSVNPSSVGQTVVFTATVSSTTPGTITGEMVFFDGASQISNPVAVSGGSAALSISSLTQGAHSITAQYSGNPSYAASTSTAITQTVNAATTAATSTAVVSSLNPATVGQSVMFTATSTSATAGTLTGTITFFDGATQIGSPVTISSGSAAVSTTTLTQGVHSITAKYSGDTKFSTSTSTALTETVNAGTLISTTTMLTGPATGTTGASVSFMASVTPASGTKVPTGTVMFLDGATTLGPGTLNGSGSATFATSTLAAGTHSITAQYGGDATFAGSTSTAVSINITAATGSFTLSATPSSVTVTASKPGMAVVTVTPANGFNQMVQFSCSNVPEGVDCEFQPNSVTPNGAPVTTMLAVTEEAENGVRRRAGTAIGSGLGRGGANSAGEAAKEIFVPVLACELMLLAGVWRRRKSANAGGRFQVAYALLLLMTVMTFVAGCSSSPKSTSGTTIMVVGTGPNNQTATVPVTVKIQK